MQNHGSRDALATSDERLPGLLLIEAIKILNLSEKFTE
jgi:hypothetical protein